MGITEGKQTRTGIDMLPEHKQKQFKQDYGVFFGVEERDAAKLDYNKLYQASREVPKGQGQGVMAAQMKDSKFAKDSKVFFGGDADDSKSAYGRAANAFYDQGAGAARMDPQKTLGGKFENVQDRIVPGNMQSELYKRDQADFVGEQMELRSTGSVYQNNLKRFHGLDTETAKFKIESKPMVEKKMSVNDKSGTYKKDQANFHGQDRAETESQGTHFQQNAARFLGEDVIPQSGERPFKLDKSKKAEEGNKGKSVLNEQRLREHVSILQYTQIK